MIERISQYEMQDNAPQANLGLWRMVFHLNKSI